MNALPKFVETRTPQALVWNSACLDEDLAGDVARLKEAPGKDILVFGSATFAEALRLLGLVDEYRLLVYPVVPGSGRRLFADEVQAKLTLKTAKRLGGAVLLTDRA